MDKTGLVLSNRRYNDYEAAYHRLRDTSNIYKDLETFDKNWEKVRTGQSNTFPNLDAYITSLDAARQKGITYESMAEKDNVDLLTEDSVMALLFAETLADKEEKKTRERVVVDDNGRPIQNSDGSYQTEQYEATDYEYIKGLLNEEVVYKQYEQYLQKEQELKDNRAFWEKVGTDIFGTMAKFTAGMSHTVAGFLKWNEGMGNAIGEFFKTWSASKAADKRLETMATFDDRVTFDKELQEAVFEFERRFTDFRDYQGRETTLGKYIGGLSYTFGQMMPGLLAAQGAGVAGGAMAKAGTVANAGKIASLGKGIATAGKIGSSLIFYEAIASDNAVEMYNQLAAQGISVSTGMILAEADIKAAAQWGIEVGLAKILGGSNLDRIVFGRSTKAGLAQFGKEVTKNALVKRALLSVAHDFVEEGLEEVFQDMSDLLIDKGFDLIFKTSFGKAELSNITAQSLFDSFIMGGLASLIGNAAHIVTTKREINPSQLKHDKNGNLIIDKKATAMALQEAYDEHDAKVARLESLKVSEMTRLGVNTEAELIANDKSKFTKEDAKFLAEADIIRDSLEKDVAVYEYEKMGKLASWAYGINLQSITENFDKIQEMTKKAILKDSKVDIEKCNAALYQLYASTRIIAAYFGEVGMERMEKANNILTYITNAYMNKDADYLDIKKKIRQVIGVIDRDQIKAQTIQKELTIHERAKELKAKQNVEGSIQPNITAEVFERIDQILSDRSDITAVSAEEFLGEPYVDSEGVAHIDINSLMNCDAIVPEASLAEQNVVNYISKAIETHRIGLSKNEQSQLIDIFKKVNNNRITDAPVHDVIRALCFDSKFVAEVLFHNEVNTFVFNTIQQIQAAVKTITVSDAYTAVVKNKYALVHDNIKAIIKAFIIEHDYIRDFNKYNIFTKEEFEEIQNARYDKDFARKIAENRMSPEDWKRLHNLVELKTNKTTADQVVALYKKKMDQLAVGYVSFTAAQLAMDVDTYLKKLLGKVRESSEFPPLTTAANRAFEYFMRSSGLDNNSLFDPSSLSKSDIAFANEFNMDISNPQAIHAAVFGVSCNNQYKVIFEKGNKKYVVTDNKLSAEDVANLDKKVIAEQVKIKNYYELYKTDNSGVFAIASFDEDQRKDFMRTFMGDEASDFDLATTRLQDLVDDPSLLSENIKQKILKYNNGKLSSMAVVVFLNSNIQQMSKDLFGRPTAALGYTNSGEVVIYNTYTVDEYFSLSQDDLFEYFKKFDKNSVETFLLGDILLDDVALKALKNITVELTDNLNDHGSYRAFENKIFIRYNSDINVMVETLYHEFQHAIQREYKMLQGFNTTDLIKVYKENGKLKAELGKKIDKDAFNKALEKLFAIYPNYEAEYKDNPVKVLYDIANMIYINSGELFAEGRGFNAQLPFAYLTPTPIYTNEAGEICVKLFGVEINTHKISGENLSSPIYSNIADVIGLENENLDADIIKLGQKISLKDIDVSNIIAEDTDASIEALYEALGGKEQFKSMADFYNHEFNVLYFERKGTDVKKHIVGTIINTDKGTIEKLMRKSEGTLFVGKVKPADILFFAPNNINNVIIDRTVAFDVDHIGVSTIIEDELAFNYMGQIVTANTNNINDAPIDINIEANTDKEQESRRILADTASTVQRLEKKYGRKVIRAEYIQGGKTDKFTRKTRYYFDGSVTSNRDYEDTAYVRPEGFYRGKKVTTERARSNQYVNRFKDKNRPVEFQEFVKEAYEMREYLPDVFRTKIEDGTLTMRDIDNYIRMTDISEIDEKTFELINKTVYKNENIKTLEDLQKLINNSSLFYGVGVVFYVLGKKELLNRRNREGVLYEIKRILSDADPKIARRIEGRISKYQKYTNISDKYLKLLYLKKYDGSIASAFRAANFAKMAIDNDWNVTGENQTISTSTEFTGDKGESFTPLEEIEDEINSDTMEWLLSEEARYKKREILKIAKRELLIKVATGKVKLESRSAFDRIVSEMKYKADEWTEAQINKFYDMFVAKEDTINKLYAQVMAEQVSGDDSYLTDKKKMSRVENAVDNVKRKPENVIRNIKNYLTTIQRNVSEAERKKFLQMNSDILNDNFTLKDEVVYDTIEDKLQLKEYEIILKLEDRMRQLAQFAKSHEISESKQKQLKVKTDEEIRQIADRIVKNREREINTQAQIYIKNETNRLKQEYNQKIVELKNQLQNESKEKTKAEISDIKAKFNKQLEDIKNKYDAQIKKIKAEAREKVKLAGLKHTVQNVRNIVRYTVANTEIDVRTSVQMPASLGELLKTQFDRAVANQIKFEFEGLTNEEQQSTHVVAEVKKFYEENASYIRTLTQDNITALAEFFVNSDLLYTTKEATYKAVAICTMNYILNTTGSANSQFTLDPNLRKNLAQKYNNIKSGYAQGAAIFREAEKLAPTKVMLTKLASQLRLDIDEGHIAMLTEAVESGNYTEMAAAQSVIYEHLLEQHQNQQVSIFDKLLKFSRTAMLSSPGTWIRNWTSNILVSSLNKASDQVGGWITKHLFDKLFKHENLKQKYKTAEAAAQALIAKSHSGNIEGLTEQQRKEFEQYQKTMEKYKVYADETQYRDLHLVKTSDEVKRFIDNQVINNGLLDLIKDGLNKYDWSVNAEATVENNIVRLITNSIRNKIFMNNIADGKVLQKWYSFIYERLSDDPYIEKAFLRYLGKTMTYDKIDISQGLTVDIMQHIADAYTLAAADYMHKPNFVHDVEMYIRRKAGAAGFFVYKNVFPFLSAGINWMVEGLKYTPVGLAWNIIRYARLEHAVDKMYQNNKTGKGTSYRFGQYLVSRDIGKGVIGTIGFAIGAMLAAFGAARIEDDDDEVKLVIGDLRVDINDIFGTNGITTGMALISAIKDNKSMTFDGTLKFVLDQMFIDSTLSNMYNTIRQSQGFGDFMMTLPLNMISNVIPNIISAVASPANIYKTKYHSGIVGKLERIATKALPSIAYALPKYVDPYTGEYQIQYKVPWTKNRSRVLAGVGTVIEKAVSKLTPLNIYAYNVSDNEEVALKLGVNKSMLTGSYTINNKKVNLSSSQTQALNMYYGKLNDKTLTAFINNKAKYKILDKKTNTYKELYYRQMTDEQRANVIDRIMDNNSDTAKIYILTTTGKYKYYAPSYEKYRELKSLGISKNLYTKTDKRSGFVEIK